MSTAGRVLTPHRCPHCRCDWTENDAPGYVNKNAPFYALVEYIDSLSLVHRATPRSGSIGRNRSGDGTALTARPPARPTEEVRHAGW